MVEVELGIAYRNSWKRAPLCPLGAQVAWCPVVLGPRGVVLLALPACFLRCICGLS